MRTDDRRCGTCRIAGPRARLSLWALVACAGAMACPGPLAMGGDEGPLDIPLSLTGLADEDTSRRVHWSAMANVWAATIDGGFSLQGTPASIDVGLFDGSGDDDDDDDDDEDDGAIGLQFRGDIAINRLVLFLGSSFAGGQDDQATFLGAPGEMNVALGWFEFGGGFRLIDVPQAGDSVRHPGFALDALVGGRVTTVGAEFDPDIGGDIDGHHTWIEPFVGGQLAWRPLPNLFLKVIGDVGGFGAGSEFSWRAEAMIGGTIRLARFNLNIHGGYRAIDQDFDNDSGDELSGWDGIVHGPTAGVTLEF